MGYREELGMSDAMEANDAVEFLERVGDEELLRFLRRLPMIAANADGSPVTMRDLTYEARLWPFVQEAWFEVPGGMGVANRILQLSRVYKLAAAKMEKLTGEVRSKERMIDLPTFLKIYSTEGMP